MPNSEQKVENLPSKNKGKKSGKKRGNYEPTKSGENPPKPATE